MAGAAHYITEIRSSTTFLVSATPKGAQLNVTSDLSAGTVSAGLLTAAADGSAQDNYVSMGSVAGGGPVQGD